MPVIRKGITTVKKKFHRHNIPVCKDGNHDKSCENYKTEHECLHVTIRNPITGEKKEYAQCYHFLH
jgi:hypothetical protein